MNILWLSPEVPYPPIGGRNGIYNRIVELGKHNRIFLFATSDSDEEEPNRQEMLKHCAQVGFYNRQRYKGKTAVKSLLLPYAVASRDDPDVKRDILACLEENAIDVIVVEFPYMLPSIKDALKRYPDIPVTINQHNIEYLQIRSTSRAVSMGLVRRFVYLAESLRLEAYERAAYKRRNITGYTFFSQLDCDWFARKLNKGERPLQVIPLGANAMPLPPEDSPENRVLFVGKLSAPNNQEAALWLAHQVLPRLQQRVPGTKLLLAGAAPSDEIKALASEDIEVMDGFASAQEVYARCSLVANAVLHGGGVKGKLLEAVAFHRPVVSTVHGVLGTDFQKEEHLLVADDPALFAEHCATLLEDQGYATELADNAFALFEDRYSWQKIGREYEEYLARLIGNVASEPA